MNPKRMVRLSGSSLERLPASVACPAYDRGAVTTGVVHLGIGAFHRAHQAAVFEAALASGDRRWGIVGASLRSPAVRDELGPQDGLYTIVVRDGAEQHLQVVGAVRDVLVAPENPPALVARLAAPETHIVTLTVTEKGYRLDPATGALATGDPDVAADLASLGRPRTAPGFLVAGLAARRAAGLPPFTAISCDNLPHNGTRLRAAVLAMALAHDASLTDWIDAHGAFPETMVDRIVPATTPDDIAALAATTGVEDRAMVRTEPFTQWVIEDRFCGPRPDFAALGVQLVPAVAPWEEAKLRLLNGAHSAIAYLGGLAGHGYVHEVVADPAFRAMVERLWDEAAETLNPPPGLDIAAYRRALMARFANPALNHRTRQIAMDGSQKLPQRLVAPALWRAERGLASPALALAVAGWIRWQAGIDDRGGRHVVDDPMAEAIAVRLAGATTAAARAAAALGIATIFPPALGTMPFARAVADQLESLEKDGAATAVTALGL